VGFKPVKIKIWNVQGPAKNTGQKADSKSWKINPTQLHNLKAGRSDDEHGNNLKIPGKYSWS
jgi:hypothetical protein